MKKLLFILSIVTLISCSNDDSSAVSDPMQGLTVFQNDPNCNSEYCTTTFTISNASERNKEVTILSHFERYDGLQESTSVSHTIFVSKNSQVDFEVPHQISNTIVSTDISAVFE